jgi:hypothetical protein
MNPAWSRATGMYQPEGDMPAHRSMTPLTILTMAKQSKSAETAASVAHFGSRALNEVADMLEAFIKTEGSVAVSGLHEFASASLLRAVYQARFGNLNPLPPSPPSSSSNQPQQDASSPRPTLTSMTDEETESTRRLDVRLTRPARRGGHGRR